MDIIKITLAEAAKRHKIFPDDSHKGTFGHAVIIGGSYGKIGAVILSLKAALRSGCGLASCFIPECGYTAVQTAVPEAMVATDVNERQLSQIEVAVADSIAIGPGMGKDFVTKKAFHRFLKSASIPIVVDADALNILAENKSWIKLLPKQSILTPHRLEWERLMGTSKGEPVKQASKLAEERDLVIVLKGAPTIIVSRSGIFENTTGNSRLATAGSGDVLSGIITALLAQGYKSIDAAILGVFVHGLSADHKITRQTRESFIASDIIANLGVAFEKVASHGQ